MFFFFQSKPYVIFPGKFGKMPLQCECLQVKDFGININEKQETIIVSHYFETMHFYFVERLEYK